MKYRVQALACRIGAPATLLVELSTPLLSSGECTNLIRFDLESTLVTDMQYQVLIESHPDKTYSAFVIGVPDCVAEGQTREEAIANAKDALTERLVQGEIVTIEVEPPGSKCSENPWLDNFGRFKDDPTFDDFLAEIEADRRASVDKGIPH